MYLLPENEKTFANGMFGDMSANGKVEWARHVSTIPAPVTDRNLTAVSLQTFIGFIVFLKIKKTNNFEKILTIAPADDDVSVFMKKGAIRLGSVSKKVLKKDYSHIKTQNQHRKLNKDKNYHG